jgi:hypothetical protein
MVLLGAAFKGHSMYVTCAPWGRHADHFISRPDSGPVKDTIMESWHV